MTWQLSAAICTLCQFSDTPGYPCPRQVALGSVMLSRPNDERVTVSLDRCDKFSPFGTRTDADMLTL